MRRVLPVEEHVDVRPARRRAIEPEPDTVTARHRGRQVKLPLVAGVDVREQSEVGLQGDDGRLESGLFRHRDDEIKVVVPRDEVVVTVRAEERSTDHEVSDPGSVQRRRQRLQVIKKVNERIAQRWNGSSFVTHDPWSLPQRMGQEVGVAFWYWTTLSILRAKNRRLK